MVVGVATAAVLLTVVGVFGAATNPGGTWSRFVAMGLIGAVALPVFGQVDVDGAIGGQDDAAAVNMRAAASAPGFGMAPVELPGVEVAGGEILAAGNYATVSGDPRVREAYMGAEEA